MHWIDPDCLLPVSSHIERFLFNFKGDADGLLLANGLEAHFPPHLSRKVLRTFRAGDVIRLFGLKPRDVDMIACVALESQSGERVLDEGPPAKAKKKSAKHKPGALHDEDLERVTIRDDIERLLHGPRGEVRGMLLSSGDIARFPPHAADAGDTLLKPGARIALKGTSRSVSGVRVIEVNAWGKSDRKLKPLPVHHP